MESFVAAAEILKERGAYKIYVMATHGILSADAPRLIEESSIDEVGLFPQGSLQGARGWPFQGAFLWAVSQLRQYPYVTPAPTVVQSGLRASAFVCCNTLGSFS